MKSTLSFCLALFLGSPLLAQTVNYKTISDDPMDIRKLRIGVDAMMTAGFSLEDNSDDGYLNFGYQIRGSYFPIINKIGIEFDLQKGTDINSGLDASKTEFRASFAIFSAQNKKDRTITIDRSVQGGSSYNHNIKTPQTFQNNLEGRFSIIRNKGFIGQIAIPPHGNHHALYSTSMLGLGLQWRSFQAYKVLIDDSYYSSNSVHFQLYADLLLGMGTSWEASTGSVASIPSEAEIEAALDTESLTSNLGGRLGFKTSTRTTKTLTLSLGAELGFIPPSKVLHSLLYFGASINLL
tara:strand:+ start:1780 stop:2661 length:882 start_codon:yes stop_codon:yes gene_type:complete